MASEWSFPKLKISFSFQLLLVHMVLFSFHNYGMRASVASPKDEENCNKPADLSKKDLIRIWVEIQSVPKKELEEEPVDYWFMVWRVGYFELEKIICSSNVREGLNFYVSQFGKTDSQSDTRWLMAASSRLLPADISIRPLTDAKDNDSLKAQLLFAEFQVKQFLSEPKLLARYYQSVVWRQRMFSDAFFPIRLGQVYRNMKKDSTDEHYWWYAQNFILMAHATGGDDFFKGAKPDQLKPCFQKWFEWFRLNGMYLRASPDTFYWVLNEGEKSRKEGYVPFISEQTLPPLIVKPKYPFPQWEGPKPPPIDDFR